MLYFFATNYHSVFFPITVIYTPDILWSGRGGLFANFIHIADRIGQQIARCRAAASRFREHDAAPAS